MRGAIPAGLQPRPSLWRRSAVALPSFADLPPRLRQELVEASASVSTLPPLDPRRVVAAEDSEFSPLYHRLSSATQALTSPGPVKQRSSREAIIFRSIRMPAASFVATEFGARKWIEQIAAQLGAHNPWRTSDIGLEPDLSGNRIMCPPAAVIPEQLRKLALVLSGKIEGPPIFLATLALVLLVNCHPFKDGNGRLGRILFNFVLHGCTRDAVSYVPLSELFNRSRGGYEIRLRQAEIRGEWEPILTYMVELLEVQRRLAECEPEHRVTV